MIKFFRTIRQNLIDTGATGRYLKYSIGEIVLVVIGILIALQINNWNENRKINIEQKLLVTQMLEDAKSDSIFFSGRLVGIAMVDTILTYIDELNQNNGETTLNSLSINGTGRVLPFSSMQFISSIMNDYTETFNKINSPEIKKILRSYNSKFIYAKGNFENLNNIIASNFEPLRFAYHKELRENRKTKSIEILNKIYKYDRVFACVDKMKLTLSVMTGRVHEILEVNNQLIQSLQSYLEEH
ncbi:MAG: hypothetical protein IPL55_03380 [Saprospiraceae bacterium]|jgi:hypothetical protein|nr:hypothetical protein [Saprospiraceae bacterium]